MWAVTEKGKKMPLDAEPAVATPHGLMTFSAGNPLAVAVKGNLYRSHFASCPDAASHRHNKGDA